MQGAHDVRQGRWPWRRKDGAAVRRKPPARNMGHSPLTQHIQHAATQAMPSHRQGAVSEQHTSKGQAQ